jgi:beta-1,4-mannosyltransferase
MGEFLSREWGISGARVVYDRPPEYFRDAARAARERGREAFWRATRIVHAMESSRLMREGDFIDSYVHGGDRGKIKGNEDDVRFVVTSTSWTPDEDFQVLLDAAVAYDARASHLAATASSSARLPRLAIIVTGK